HRLARSRGRLLVQEHQAAAVEVSCPPLTSGRSARILGAYGSMARVVVVGVGILSTPSQANDRSAIQESDLRVMLENAGGFHENHEPGRWAIRQNKMKQRF